MTIALHSLLGQLFSFHFVSGFSLRFHLVLAFGTYSSVFSLFLLSLFISMKLGEAVTYPGFAGVSLCGHVPIYSVCAQWL